MAITFAVRGDSFDARYSSAGASPGITGNLDQVISTDEPGINGVNSIDLAGAFLTQRPLIYNGRENTPSGIARSVLMRVKFESHSLEQGLFFMGVMTRNDVNAFYATVTTGGEVTLGVGDAVSSSDEGTTTGAAMTNVTNEAGAAVWHDILCSWTGDNSANGLEVWVDGTRRLQDTMTRSLPTPFTSSDRLGVANMMIGTSNAQVNTHMYVDEIVVWDTVIADPTSVGLTSGTGSLNGASRTAYVDVAAFDGSAATGGRVIKSL